MWQSVQLFLLFLLTNVLVWLQVSELWPFLALWIPGLAWILAVVWWKRFRRGVPLTSIERKMSAIWWMFCAAFFLTAGLNQLMGLKLAQSLPIVALEFGLAFACMALMLGGEFYITAVLCAVLALVLVRFPQWAAVLIGTTIGVGLFVPAWRHARRQRRAMLEAGSGGSGAVTLLNEAAAREVAPLVETEGGSGAESGSL
jgi:hypothetical protein